MDRNDKVVLLVENEQLRGKVAWLQAIVDKLPKCWGLNEAGELVQDVSVVPGMEVWAQKDGMIFKWEITRMDADGWCWLKRKEPCDSPGSPEIGIGTKGFYNTRAAAQAAKEKQAQ